MHYMAIHNTLASQKTTDRQYRNMTTVSGGKYSGNYYDIYEILGNISTPPQTLEGSFSRPPKIPAMSAG